jgi:hypothetical protein
MVWVHFSRRGHHGYWKQAAHEFIHASAGGAGVRPAGGCGLWRAHGAAPGRRESLHFAAADAGAPLYYPVADHGSRALELSASQDVGVEPPHGSSQGIPGTALRRHAWGVPTPARRVVMAAGTSRSWADPQSAHVHCLPDKPASPVGPDRLPHAAQVVVAYCEGTARNSLPLAVHVEASMPRS